MLDDERLPSSLEQAVDLLRDGPPIRDEWRSALDVQLSQQVTRRVWHVRPMHAIAACAMFVLFGGAVTATFLLSRDNARVASTAPQSMVRFDLVAPSAVRVSIVGDFNGWNAEALPMRRSGDGRTWQLDVKLPPGRYTYGFVVDGRLVRDPSAPESGSDDFGVPSSVVLVSHRGGST